MGNLDKLIMWFAGAVIVALLLYAIFAGGVHSARHDICNKVGGVYVQTYSQGPQCLQAVLVEMK